MIKEKSCGALVFHRDAVNGKLYIVLIRHVHGRFFSFPKGHVEKGESEKETAEREVFEETALKIDITSDFRETVSYNPSYKVQKEVVYFLAETEQTHVVARPGEIEKVRWVSVDDALNVLTHENDSKTYALNKEKLDISYKHTMRNIKKKVK